MTPAPLRGIALLVGGLLAASGTAVAAPPAGQALTGSEWELVSIQSMDDAQGTLRIADPAQFTLQFGADGRAALKLDCNRGTASWKATPAAGEDSGQISFGPVAGTRALCSPPHLDERVVRDLTWVRGYLLTDGNLYLSLMADGGIYEWRPRATVLGNPADPMAGRVLGSAIRTHDAEELRYYVLSALTDRLAAAEGIAATPEEIAAFSASTAAALRADRDQAIARRDDLQRQLAAGGLPAARRAELQRELAAQDEVIAALAPQDAAGDRAARAEIAAAFIRQWKINRALQQKYGGRIIFQQGGPEPLDATRRFLEAAQAAGDFAIADPALEKAFWAYYRDDARHSFYAPGSREEAAAFATPP
jgi:heat shock protein HslJ